MRGNMHPTLATSSERVVKKVSRACNTCRLKRKKCDGLDPCAFCVDNKLECLYSTEPRRRGPPSGYLRYTETRVAILEILLGLYLSKLPKKEEDDGEAFDPFFEIAQILQSETKTCTQDVWDAHRALWTTCRSSKLVEELVVSFAPFTPRSAQDAPAKTLLPLPATSPGNSTAHDLHSASTSSSAQRKDGPERKSGEKQRQSANQISFTHTFKPESFERGQNADRLRDSTSPISVRTQGEPGPSTGVMSMEEREEEWQDDGVPRGRYLNIQDPVSDSVQLVYPSQNYQRDSAQLQHTGSIRLEDTPDLGLTLGLGGQEYTGSYWRTVDLALPESESFMPTSSITQPNLVPPPPTSPIDVPPSHILSQLLDVYYQHAHPSYPLLPCRATLDATLISPSGKSEIWSTLTLSICAYSGRLSLSTHPASNSLAGMGGLAGKIAADLWYEQARTSLSALLKKGSSLELVQASLLLALRDYGKGNENQAWVLVGLAVRMAQDLQLHEDSSTENPQTSPQETQLCRNVWGVCVILDLLLSLQMGKPPATSDALKGSLLVGSRSRPPDMDLNPSPPFTYAVSLCRVIAMINFHLYLGYPSSTAQSPPDKLSHLRSELEVWHHSLPMQYRISIGHQPRRDVLEINMLYHVAIILLYRPVSRDHLDQRATDIFLEAASAFNVLLEKYRQSQATMALSNPITGVPTLSHTNPNMIYLIYTVAIAHLSGYKLRQSQHGNANTPTSVSPTSALQTQLHLLKCLEALASIGFTWELARRCWKVLDTFMEMENLKPRAGEVLDENNPLILGKRKRELEDNQKRTWQPMSGRMEGSVTHGSPAKQFQQIQQQQQQQQHSSPSYSVNLSPVPDIGTMLTPSPNLPTSFSTGRPQMAQPPSTNINMTTSGWDGSANVPYASTTDAGFPVFDPSLFSTRWMPAASQALNAEWNNSWDENAWPQSFVNGMGMF